MSAPAEEYAGRLAGHRAAVTRLDGADRLIASLRLADAALVVVVAWWAFGAGTLSGWWLLAPVAAFAALVVWHGRVIDRRTATLRAIAYYERGVARIEDRWIGIGPAGDRFADDQHLYARDLDLFGPGSLFQLLSTARTAIGEQTLAAWLLAPAEPAVIGRRQEALADLRDRVTLREDLAVVGRTDTVSLDADHLGRWGAATPRLTSVAARGVAALLALSAIVAAIGWWKLGWGYWPLAGVLGVEILFALTCREAVEAVVTELRDASPELDRLAQILGRLEREPFTAPALVALQQELRATGEAPSRAISHLSRLVTMLDSTENQIFAPFAAALLWTTQIAFTIEAWRARHGAAVATWLRIVGEAEALLSLAAYSFEHPADPFPAIVHGDARFDGEALGHPLLPDAKTTRNDVALGGDEAHAILVSGSNMSGKSTLLRTVGINAVLALAGAPVRARALTISPVAIGATLRIEDSLQAGRSRFFAEISRLHELVDLTRGPRPLLFLLDEIFHGTNSHDRRAGAEAVVRSLVAAGAIGLVTTHDLALTELTAQSAGAIVNMHFEDQFVDGTMTFDYRLRPGVVQKSNALALMRSVGLDV